MTDSDHQMANHAGMALFVIRFKLVSVQNLYDFLQNLVDALVLNQEILKRKEVVTASLEESGLQITLRSAHGNLGLVAIMERILHPDRFCNFDVVQMSFFQKILNLLLFELELSRIGQMLKRRDSRLRICLAL